MPASSPRLPVLATVKAAFADVFKDFPGTLRGMWLMLLLTVVFTEIPGFFIGRYMEIHFFPEVKQLHAAVQELSHSNAPLTPFEINIFATMQGIGLVFSGIGALFALFLFCYMHGWYGQLLRGVNKGKRIDLRLGRDERSLIWTGTKVLGIQSCFFISTMMVIFSAFADSGGAGPARFDPLPYLAVIAVFALYTQAHYALAYPATVMGDTHAPLRQSSHLTQRQRLRIALGNILVSAPFLIALVAWSCIGIAPELAKQPGSLPVLLALTLGLKAVSDFLLFLSVAALSAYHARCYAYLVRSSSSSALH